MKLHLLRHAKTNQDSPSGEDFDRELLPKGVRQAKEMANYLSKLTNIEVHCSSAARTRKTLDLIKEKANFNEITYSRKLYLSSRMELLDYITGLTTSADLLVIGHNNGISDFARYLTNRNISFKTCGYACLEINIDTWAELSKDQATLLDSYRPDLD